MQRRMLYALVLGGALLAYGWIGWNWQRNLQHMPPVCLFRKVTGIPCPSCGTTHAVVDLARMQFLQALKDNPLGYVMAVALLVFPVWVVVDLLSRRSSFFQGYVAFEQLLRQRRYAIPLLLLLLANWVWNIIKYTS